MQDPEPSGSLAGAGFVSGSAKASLTSGGKSIREVLVRLLHATMRGRR